MTTANSINTYIVPTTSYEVTMPAQPAFLAYNSATDLNVTGNGTFHTIVFDTEVFDQNADYNNGTGVFTAPVTGRYLLCTVTLLTGITNATDFSIRILTSNRNYSRFIGRAAFAGDMSLNISCIADMDAADTAYVNIYAFGEGADNDDLVGGATLSTFFSGMLIT